MADKFEKAVEIVNGLPKEGPVQPSSDDKLEFYAWYKTATVGEVNTTRPGMLDFVGKAKWDAWKKHEKKDKEECKKLYVEKLTGILESSETPEAKEYLGKLKA